MMMQLLFKTLVSSLQGPFFSTRRRDRGLDAEARSRAKIFPKLTSFFGVRHKKFLNSNPTANSPKAFKFP
ncbi:MAG: hypothetical protein DBX55_07620 [Verrucomicrobia bacterium]|nr:MAG: hypothetical protein DBX55_07620 [Verrucomicrobiota bacterium]